MIMDSVYTLPHELDRKYLQNLSERILCENSLSDDFKYFENLPYKSVPSGNQMWYLEMISRFSDTDDPEVFGMPSISIHDSDI